MTEQEQLDFYRLLEKFVENDDMAVMNIINKAVELKQLIDEL
jgi:hypothetical protein